MLTFKSNTRKLKNTRTELKFQRGQSGTQMITQNYSYKKQLQMISQNSEKMNNDTMR